MRKAILIIAIVLFLSSYAFIMISSKPTPKIIAVGIDVIGISILIYLVAYLNEHYLVKKYKSKSHRDPTTLT